jgi:hypothetical protein
VRSSLAALLAAIVSFPLMLPMLSPAPESNVPACCRKDGKHACSMMSKAASHHDNAPAVSLKKEVCPLFPTGKTSPASARVSTVPPAQALSAQLLTFMSAPEQMEARYRVSFNRSWQKRGPPSLS